MYERPVATADGDTILPPPSQPVRSLASILPSDFSNFSAASILPSATPRSCSRPHRQVSRKQRTLSRPSCRRSDNGSSPIPQRSRRRRHRRDCCCGRNIPARPETKLEPVSSAHSKENPIVQCDRQLFRSLFCEGNFLQLHFDAESGCQLCQ